jgi:hypothetical protein
VVRYRFAQPGASDAGLSAFAGLSEEIRIEAFGLGKF